MLQHPPILKSDSRVFSALNRLSFSILSADFANQPNPLEYLKLLLIFPKMNFRFKNNSKLLPFTKVVIPILDFSKSVEMFNEKVC